ncbi:helix-turn-helix domain-containing protein [Pseudomonas sp. Bout1]|uniref:helix-turn-helix domain-containing protein n=1 Tax=Pseudomonas sp. Bout1 TaxID=3048600 RepID=UPI002AB35337|nr:helix-turn-helix domain-containing protein [Pseudomonas sp. Bout1]MDY7534042.1 helix-turn-helix domain-containing protein [Pseudomonas sp. Bout1]MEB0186029.1 helix-turn-helix domain-containing protein [Pseudomonas sp. Bout1]
MKEIGRRLKNERQRMGLTVQRLAHIGGVTPIEQQQYELGETLPRADYLAAVANEGMDVVYVVTGKKQAIVKLSWEKAQELLDNRVIAKELFQGEGEEEILFKVTRPKNRST